MKRLEYLKALAALLILLTTHNAYFDLIGIPKREEIHSALSLLCVLLFLTGLYHDHLSKQLMNKALSEEHEAFSMARKAGQELLFREGLLSFLLFVPVIPAILVFPKEAYLGLSLFLFPMHGIIRVFRTKWMKGMILIVGEERVTYPLRSTRSIRYESLKKVAVKYEHLYFILKDDRVETLPLEFLPQDQGVILDRLGERLMAHGVKGSEALQELGGSVNRSV